MVRVTVPTIGWYKKLSTAHGIEPRCPYATVESCPRYYESLWLLGTAGDDPIPKSEDRRLYRKWRKSDLWYRTREYAASISGSNKNIFDNFCPEVAFNRFGYFATYLYRFTDDIDREGRIRILKSEPSIADDWRLHWADLTPLHYSDCPLFSILNHRHKIDGRTSFSGIPKRVLRDHFTQILVGVTVTIIGGIVLSLLL
jgi:hypothetical protein